MSEQNQGDNNSTALPVVYTTINQAAPKPLPSVSHVMSSSSQSQYQASYVAPTSKQGSANKSAGGGQHVTTASSSFSNNALVASTSAPLGMKIVQCTTTGTTSGTISMHCSAPGLATALQQFHGSQQQQQHPMTTVTTRPARLIRPQSHNFQLSLSNNIGSNGTNQVVSTTSIAQSPSSSSSSSGTMNQVGNKTQPLTLSDSHSVSTTSPNVCQQFVGASGSQMHAGPSGSQLHTVGAQIKSTTTRPRQKRRQQQQQSLQNQQNLQQQQPRQQNPQLVQRQMQQRQQQLQLQQTGLQQQQQRNLQLKQQLQQQQQQQQRLIRQEQQQKYLNQRLLLEQQQRQMEMQRNQAIALERQQAGLSAKQMYRMLKKRFNLLVYENECYQEQLRNSQRKLLKLSRDKNFLLDRMMQFEEPSNSSDDSDSNSVATVEDKPVKKKPRNSTSVTRRRVSQAKNKETNSSVSSQGMMKKTLNVTAKLSAKSEANKCTTSAGSLLSWLQKSAVQSQDSKNNLGASSSNSTNSDDIASADKEQINPVRTSAVESLRLSIEDISWRRVLLVEFRKDYMKKIADFLEIERNKGKTIFPPQHLIFNAFNLTPLKNISVVLIGQDPYHDHNQAHGLCFSVSKGVRPPPSLMNMYKELKTDIPKFKAPDHGCLESWARQGVFMLNASLTVEAHKANSHSGIGWQLFTDEVIRIISRDCQGVVFLLWGAFAHKKEILVDRKKHAIVKAAHPSPLSARFFLGCKCFSRTNQALAKFNKPPIDWCSF